MHQQRKLPWSLLVAEELVQGQRRAELLEQQRLEPVLVRELVRELELVQQRLEPVLVLVLVLVQQL